MVPTVPKRNVPLIIPYLANDPTTRTPIIVSPGKHQDTVLERGELERAQASPHTTVTDPRDSLVMHDR